VAISLFVCFLEAKSSVRMEGVDKQGSVEYGGETRMTKLTVDLDHLKPLLDQAKETQRNIEQMYKESQGYLRIANTQSGSGTIQLEAAYKRSNDQLGAIVSVLQTTYNAIRELQSDGPSRSSSTWNLWSRWFTGPSGYGEPIIKYMSSTRQVVEGIMSWTRVPPSANLMMEQTKSNALLASGGKSIQELAEANASGIRLKGQWEAYHQELLGWMQELAKAYSQGGQSEVDVRTAQMKETDKQAYEQIAPYAEYVRYFDEGIAYMQSVGDSTVELVGQAGQFVQHFQQGELKVVEDIAKGYLKFWSDPINQSKEAATETAEAMKVLGGDGVQLCDNG
jgi:hypothetical protein